MNTIGIAWKDRFGDLKPAWYQKQSNIDFVSKIFIALGVVFASVTLWTAFFWAAPPAILINTVSKFAITTLLCFALGIIPRFKSEYMQDPEYRRAIGRLMEKDIEKNQLTYTEIKKKYSNEIKQGIWTNDDFNALFAQYLKRPKASYSDFVDLHGKDALTILNESNREALKKKFVDFFTSTKCAYKDLIGKYSQVMIAFLRISAEDVSMYMKGEINALKGDNDVSSEYMKFKNKHGLQCISKTWNSEGIYIIPKDSDEYRVLKAKLILHLRQQEDLSLKSLKESYGDDCQLLDIPEEVQKALVIQNQYNKLFYGDIPYARFRRNNGGSDVLTMLDDEQKLRVKTVHFGRLGYKTMTSPEYKKDREILGVTDDDIHDAVWKSFNELSYPTWIEGHTCQALTEIKWTVEEWGKIQDKCKTYLSSLNPKDIFAHLEDAQILYVSIKNILLDHWKDKSMTTILSQDKKAFELSLEKKIFKPEEWTNKAVNESKSITLSFFNSLEFLIQYKVIQPVDLEEKVILYANSKLESISTYPWTNDKYWTKITELGLETENVKKMIRGPFLSYLEKKSDSPLYVMETYDYFKKALKSLSISEDELASTILPFRWKTGLEKEGYAKFSKLNGFKHIKAFLESDSDAKKAFKTAFCQMPYPNIMDFDFKTDHEFLGVSKEDIKNALLLDFKKTTYPEWIKKHKKNVLKEVNWTDEEKKEIGKQLDLYLRKECLVDSLFDYFDDAKELDVSMKEILSKRWEGQSIDKFIKTQAFALCLKHNIFPIKEWKEKILENIQSMALDDIVIGIPQVVFTYNIITAKDIEGKVKCYIKDKSLIEYPWENDNTWNITKKYKLMTDDVNQTLKTYFEKLTNVIRENKKILLEIDGNYTKAKNEAETTLKDANNNLNLRKSALESLIKNLKFQKTQNESNISHCQNEIKELKNISLKTRNYNKNYDKQFQKKESGYNQKYYDQFNQNVDQSNIQKELNDLKNQKNELEKKDKNVFNAYKKISEIDNLNDQIEKVESQRMGQKSFENFKEESNNNSNKNITSEKLENKLINLKKDLNLVTNTLSQAQNDLLDLEKSIRLEKEKNEKNCKLALKGVENDRNSLIDEESKRFKEKTKTICTQFKLACQ